MVNPRIDGNAFLEAVRPALGRCDAPGLAHAVKSRWRVRDVASMLRHPSSEIKRIAAVALSLIGDGTCVGALTRALHDDDWQVNEQAENALWSIWFRSGDPAAAKPFCRGVSLMSEEKYHDAIVCFQEATRIDPNFAEAYNQCAIAHFLVSEWRPCITASRHAIQLVPVHFGAFAGMGHAYVELDHLEKAVQCYRRALRINPRMPAITGALPPLEAAIQDRRDSSGIYTLER